MPQLESRWKCNCPGIGKLRSNFDEASQFLHAKSPDAFAISEIICRLNSNIHFMSLLHTTDGYTFHRLNNALYHCLAVFIFPLRRLPDCEDRRLSILPLWFRFKRWLLLIFLYLLVNVKSLKSFPIRLISFSRSTQMFKLLLWVTSMYRGWLIPDAQISKVRQSTILWFPTISTEFLLFQRVPDLDRDSGISFPYFSLLFLRASPLGSWSAATCLGKPTFNWSHFIDQIKFPAMDWQFFVKTSLPLRRSKAWVSCLHSAASEDYFSLILRIGLFLMIVKSLKLFPARLIFFSRSTQMLKLLFSAISISTTSSGRLTPDAQTSTVRQPIFRNIPRS